MLIDSKDTEISKLLKGENDVTEKNNLPGIHFREKLNVKNKFHSLTSTNSQLD